MRWFASISESPDCFTGLRAAVHRQRKGFCAESGIRGCSNSFGEILHQKGLHDKRSNSQVPSLFRREQLAKARAQDDADVAPRGQ
jgi:hypothetical protein